MDAFGNCYFVEECASLKGQKIKLTNPCDEIDLLGGFSVINASGKTADPSTFSFLESCERAVKSHVRQLQNLLVHFLLPK